MKISLKLLVAAFVLLVLPSAVQAATVGGNAIPKYSYGQIFAPNQTVDVIPSTSSVSGNVWGVRCITSSTSDSVAVNFTVDGGTVRTITLDPLLFEADANGRLISGWVPLDVTFSISIRVQIHNTTLTAGTIDCWAAWGTN
jgi:hypothetical protein